LPTLATLDLHRDSLTFSALYFLFAWSVLSEVRGGSAQRIAQHPATVSMAKQRGVDPNAFADNIQKKAEKYASGLRFSVCSSQERFWLRSILG
jgi:hypothetical protein